MCENLATCFMVFDRSNQQGNYINAGEREQPNRWGEEALFIDRYIYGFNVFNSRAYNYLAQRGWEDISENVIASIVMILSSKTGIPIRDEILNNIFAVIRWIDINFDRLFMVMEAITLEFAE